MLSPHAITAAMQETICKLALDIAISHAKRGVAYRKAKAISEYQDEQAKKLRAGNSLGPQGEKQ